MQFAQHTLGKSVRCFFAFVHHRVALTAFAVLGLRRELMPVGDKHFPFVEQRAEFCRDEFKRIVIVIRGFGIAGPEAVL